jgi:hypothetical protein
LAAVHDSIHRKRTSHKANNTLLFANVVYNDPAARDVLDSSEFDARALELCDNRRGGLRDSTRRVQAEPAKGSDHGFLCLAK